MLPRRSLLALLALPLAASACGGSKGNSASTVSQDPATAVKSAALKTAGAGSEHLALTGSVVSSGQTVQISGNGDFNTKTHVGSLKATLTTGGVDTALEEVSKGSAVYVKSDLLSALVPGNKTWIKLDLATIAKSQGLNASALLAEDPSEALKQLQALKNVTKIGTEQVGGVATTRYHAAIDVAKLPGALTKGNGAYDVWVGDDGYIHRVRAVISSSGSKVTVTTDFSDFGKKVSATAPPASQTFDGSGMTIPGLGG